MAPVPTADPRLQSAIASCVEALRGLADYELEPSLEQRMFELGEGKEGLDAAAHGELMALVEFAQRRTVEKLGARLALQRLREFFPEAVDEP